ncbi:MAG: alpha/beta fold hydrolase [Alphaproteobacteria bacterium]|nr:alpha/beta fold hydrolase [Alphaproteobacteria bacterium]
MIIDIGEVKLFFDVEGAKLAPEGPEMRERPTLLLLHGGPGFDHSHLRATHSRLADVAQLIFLDHRGNGRSERSTPDKWHLDQWADDLHAFCLALGIEKPAILGLSFGGFVAQAYAIRYPEQLSKLILSSTAGKMRYDRIFAMFESLGGAAARQIAERFWHDAAAPGALEPYLEICFPLYNQTPQDPDIIKRAVMNPAVLGHFFGEDGEGHKFDFLPELKKIRCPTLVMSGEVDPVTPVEQSVDLAAALPQDLVRLERFAGCGHGVASDDPDGADRVMREFLTS